MIKKEGDFRAFLEESLGKLGIDTIDFYHMHSLNEMLYKEKVVRFDLLGKAQKAKDEGLISHISFSFHDKPEMLKEMADLGVFDSVLCQYNFLDRTNQEAISYAKSKGLGIAVMGPLAGGRIFDTVSVYNIERDRLARLALGFVVSNKDVDIAISGMEDITVLKKNLEALEGFQALGKDEKGLLDRIFSDKKTGQMIPCNNCGYCVPCPEDVAIPEIFKIYNYYKMTDLLGNSRFQYRKISEVLEKNTGEACIRCGECEEKCPQKIGIMDKLEDIEKTFKV